MSMTSPALRKFYCFPHSSRVNVLTICSTAALLALLAAAAPSRPLRFSVSPPPVYKTIDTQPPTPLNNTMIPARHGLLDSAMDDASYPGHNFDSTFCAHAFLILLWSNLFWFSAWA
jgi:hypothetical protein